MMYSAVRLTTWDINGITTTYHYNNGMLLSETTGDETLRFYYDSTGKVATITYKKGEGEENSYFFARNVQGDIIAVYRNSDSAIIGTYEYDLWGKPVAIKEAEDGIDTDGILTKNPFRYRSYYYDNETGYYYLKARYYDPEIRRFISVDSMNLLMVATTSVNCKNLFNYSENNPVMNKDASGAIVESAFDVLTLAGSVVDVCCRPTDPWAWASLAGDVVDLIPCVTGVGECIKGIRATARVAKKVETVVEGVQAVSKASSKLLRKNLIDAGVNVPEYANAAHHIVAGASAKAAEARAILQKFGIDINDAANGTFLPTVKGVSNAAYHPS